MLAWRGPSCVQKDHSRRSSSTRNCYASLSWRPLLVLQQQEVIRVFLTKWRLIHTRSVWGINYCFSDKEKYLETGCYTFMGLCNHKIFCLWISLHNMLPQNRIYCSLGLTPPMLRCRIYCICKVSRSAICTNYHGFYFQIMLFTNSQRSKTSKIKVWYAALSNIAFKGWWIYGYLWAPENHHQHTRHRCCHLLTDSWEFWSCVVYTPNSSYYHFIHVSALSPCSLKVTNKIVGHSKGWRGAKSCIRPRHYSHVMA